MQKRRTGSTRRHFLGVTTAAAGRLAAAITTISAVVAPSSSKAMGAKWWKNKPDRGGGNDGAQCFVRGTHIQTSRGIVPVENLVIGDRVTVSAGHDLPIVWIARRKFKRSGARWQNQVMPVRIAAHALGDNLPCRDLFLSPGHALLIDGVLVDAGDLVNGVSVTREAPDDGDILEYYHVALESHQAVLAEGVPTETLLLEPGIHERYSNAAEFMNACCGIKMPMQRLAPRVGFGGRLHLKAFIRNALRLDQSRKERVEEIYDAIVDRA